LEVVKTPGSKKEYAYYITMGFVSEVCMLCIRMSNKNKTICLKMSNCTKKEIFLYPRIIQAPFQQIKHPNSMVHLPDC
jgi:hypothetical protein